MTVNDTQTPAPTRYCYDTEFLEDGSTIELISIGIVADDGREYYAVNADMDTDRIFDDKWLRENVWPSLPIRWNGSTATPFLDKRSAVLKPKWVIANEVREFLLGGRGSIELWADYAAYDHVVLAQLFGKMIDLPAGIPMYTNDIEQEISRLPGFVTPEQTDGKHNALADARHNLTVLQALAAAFPS